MTDSTLGLLGSPAMSFLQMGPKGSAPIPSRDLCPTCSPGQGNVETAGEVKSPWWGLDPFLPLPYPHQGKQGDELGDVVVYLGEWCLLDIHEGLVCTPSCSKTKINNNKTRVGLVGSEGLHGAGAHVGEC